MGDKFESTLVLIGFVVAAAVVAFIIWAMWDTASGNSEGSVQLQNDCVQHGGSYIEDVGCLMLVEVQR